jgi:hypothetical protein
LLQAPLLSNLAPRADLILVPAILVVDWTEKVVR